MAGDSTVKNSLVWTGSTGLKAAVRNHYALQMDEFCLRDCNVLAHRLQNRFWNLSVQPDQRHRLRPALRFAPPQSERRNVYSMLSERRSHVPNHAGLVIIPQVEDRAIELCLERDAIDAHDARRAVMQHGSFRRKPQTSRHFRERRNFEGVGKAVLAPPRL